MMNKKKCKDYGKLDFNDNYESDPKCHGCPKLLECVDKSILNS